ncbi:hypothetical protein JCM8097_000231 [Rhodosporidiobolus ruineniae]
MATSSRVTKGYVPARASGTNEDVVMRDLKDGRSGSNGTGSPLVAGSSSSRPPSVLPTSATRTSTPNPSAKKPAAPKAARKAKRSRPRSPGRLPAEGENGAPKPKKKKERVDTSSASAVSASPIPSSASNTLPSPSDPSNKSATAVQHRALPPTSLSLSADFPSPGPLPIPSTPGTSSVSLHRPPSTTSSLPACVGPSSGSSKTSELGQDGACEWEDEDWTAQEVEEGVPEQVTGLETVIVVEAAPVKAVSSTSAATANGASTALHAPTHSWKQWKAPRRVRRRPGASGSVTDDKAARWAHAVRHRKTPRLALCGDGGAEPAAALPPRSTESDPSFVPLASRLGFNFDDASTFSVEENPTIHLAAWEGKKESELPDVLYRVDPIRADGRKAVYSASSLSLDPQLKRLERVNKQVPSTTSVRCLEHLDAFFTISGNIFQDVYSASPYGASLLTIPSAMDWARQEHVEMEMNCAPAKVEPLKAAVGIANGLHAKDAGERAVAQAAAEGATDPAAAGRQAEESYRPRILVRNNTALTDTQADNHSKLSISLSRNRSTVPIILGSFNFSAHGTGRVRDKQGRNESGILTESAALLLPPVNSVYARKTFEEHDRIEKEQAVSQNEPAFHSQHPIYTSATLPPTHYVPDVLHKKRAQERAVLQMELARLRQRVGEYEAGELEIQKLRDSQNEVYHLRELLKEKEVDIEANDRLSKALHENSNLRQRLAEFGDSGKGVTKLETALKEKGRLLQRLGELEADPIALSRVYQYQQENKMLREKAKKAGISLPPAKQPTTPVGVLDPYAQITQRDRTIQRLEQRIESLQSLSSFFPAPPIHGPNPCPLPLVPFDSVVASPSAAQSSPAALPRPAPSSGSCTSGSASFATLTAYTSSPVLPPRQLTGLRRPPLSPPKLTPEELASLDLGLPSSSSTDSQLIPPELLSLLGLDSTPPAPPAEFFPLSESGFDASSSINNTPLTAFSSAASASYSTSSSSSVFGAGPLGNAGGTGGEGRYGLSSIAEEEGMLQNDASGGAFGEPSRARDGIAGPPKPALVFAESLPSASPFPPFDTSSTIGSTLSTSPALVAASTTPPSARMSSTSREGDEGAQDEDVRPLSGATSTPLLPPPRKRGRSRPPGAPETGYMRRKRQKAEDEERKKLGLPPLERPKKFRGKGKKTLLREAQRAAAQQMHLAAPVCPFFLLLLHPFVELTLTISLQVDLEAGSSAATAVVDLNAIHDPFSFAGPSSSAHSATSRLVAPPTTPADYLDSTHSPSSSVPTFDTSYRMA